VKTLPPYPFPSRNPAFPNEYDVIWDRHKADLAPHEEIFNKRRYGREALLYKAQYFSLEEMLLQAFEFVAPDSSNANTYSIKFATIIKDSCNVFEVICRDLYSKFYLVPSGKSINILNFLSLDQYLRLSQVQLVLVAALDQFSAYPEVTVPFTGVSGLAPTYNDHNNLPAWWKAYNDIKHSNKHISQAATLVNTLASLAALFTLLNQTYGYGLVYGMASLPNPLQGFLPNAKSSLLFSPEP
jgi:hypothetical protein